MCNVPCKTCPWRKSSRVGGADIPYFNLDDMRGLVNSFPPEGSKADGFFPIMACHHSREGADKPCIGYVNNIGFDNIAVRMLQSRDRINLSQIREEVSGIEVYEDFKTMLADYEEYHANK